MKNLKYPVLYICLIERVTLFNMVGIVKFQISLVFYISSINENN